MMLFYSSKPIEEQIYNLRNQKDHPKNKMRLSNSSINLLNRHSSSSKNHLINDTMRSIFILTFVIIYCNALPYPTDIPQPPSIFKGPGYEQLFQVINIGSDKLDKPFSIDCEASGNPSPNYHWKKNGVNFDYVAYDKRISQQPKRGTLVFGKPESMDEGLYQCFATNEHGTSLSNAVFLRKAELNSFSNSQPEQIEVEEGQPLSLDCNSPSGYPKPVLNWVIYGSSSTINSVNSSRLTMDPEGKLHLSNVTREDQLNNADYACYVHNQIISIFFIGRRINLRVKQADSTGQTSHAPSIQYISPPNVPALYSQTLDLHCIFSGTPLPAITWRRKSGNMDDNKYSVLNYGKTLRIASVDFSDEDIFECTASNGIGRQISHAMQITVQAAPYWIKSPANTDAPENDTIKFECEAGGIPRPKLQVSSFLIINYFNH